VKVETILDWYVPLGQQEHPRKSPNIFWLKTLEVETTLVGDDKNIHTLFVV